MRISNLFIGVAPFAIMASAHAEVATVGLTQESGVVGAARAAVRLDSATSRGLPKQGNAPRQQPDIILQTTRLTS